MSFDWREHDDQPLEERYDRETLGFGPWSRFLDVLPHVEVLEIDRETTELHERVVSAFWEFRRLIDSETPAEAAGKMRPGHPIVFVSHQRSDLDHAERIAELACDQGIDYWLDVQDPSLRLANQTISPKDPRYPVIIAAIIEMALLNSTNLIAVHSLNSMASKWVPYELGRVRDRRLHSSNAGGWFHPAVHPRQCGDYVHLCKIARGGEQPVTSWLNDWADKPITRLAWPGNPTKRLPV